MAKNKRDIGSRLENRQRPEIKAVDLYGGAEDETAAKQNVAPTEKKKPGRKKQTPEEAVEPYSTRMKPGHKMEVKLFALAQGVNDYEVLEKALDEYFERHQSIKKKAGL